MLTTLTFLGMIGGPQIILIIAVVLLLFGGRKIPELMKGLGSGIKEFKNATKEEENPKVDEKKD
ncbi:MAG: twin-arginine translocase TatA/TatE family subunit [Flavobacteriaceae bacterium]|jgi:sec-independent protein translocase protein TatA|nr:twin-arginine translocase TatA/TatE family subunit [Flavobacteriaceae bacterium]MDG2503511.1 twin-arginine translocase TatA/TatE family subunit [Flavobacteriaceae bacterium]|tara:strand:- start:774 stop:965 length:192 start_codon:yes stop_codon:yes gene_type:complete